MGGTSMKDVGGAGFAGSSPPFLGRERAAVDVDLVRSAAALATMRPVLLLRRLKKVSAVKLLCPGPGTTLFPVIHSVSRGYSKAELYSGISPRSHPSPVHEICRWTQVVAQKVLLSESQKPNP